jgi:hypothetical protein
MSNSSYFRRNINITCLKIQASAAAAILQYPSAANDNADFLTINRICDQYCANNSQVRTRPQFKSHLRKKAKLIKLQYIL